MLTWAWYASILLFVGASSLGHTFAEAPRWPRRLTFVALAAALLLSAIVILRLWTQTYDAFGGDQPLEWAHARVILFETPWGAGWMWQFSATVTALLAVIAWRWKWSAWPIAAVCGSIVGFVTALTGHAVAMEDQRWITVVAHGIHVVSAGWWIGALAVILLVTARADYERDAQARFALSRVIDRFSPMAIAAVVTLMLAGAVATWQHVGSWSGFASPYGLAVLGKIAAFCGACLCGLYNWRVLSPSVASSPDAARQLRTMAWLEVTLGVVALVLTALLGTLSMPERPGAGGHAGQSVSGAFDDGLQPAEIRFKG